MENKTPDPKAPGGAQDAKNMGGPQFHPQMDRLDKEKAPQNDRALSKDENDDGAILKENQVPPL